MGGRARVVNVVGTLRVEVVWGLAGTVAELVVVVEVDETWSLKAPPGIVKEVVEVAVAVVELLSVESQSSSVGVAVAVLGVLVLDVRGFDVIEAVFDEVELDVAVVDDVRN